MGVSFPCPPADFDDMDKRFEAVIVRSISFGGGNVKTVLRSVSFNGRDSKPTTMKSFDSGKMIFEASLSFKGREMGTMISFKSLSSNKEENVFVRSVSVKKKNTGHNSPRSDGLPEKKPQSPLSKPENLRHQAAVKLQKVYKSFRTRRQLADCAVVVEQRWWKLLDFAELKRSSISFFDIEKPETAFSRWSRARTRAAKVGKGLSKDEQARKLALQHWLEAIDPRHRYGHNLQFYYVKWLHCESKQPFFYWLDIGEGKEVNLDRCPRPKLQQQCIKYLGPIERKAYEVVVDNGKFLYKQSGQLLDTKGESKDDKWIFVLSTSKKFYVGQKNKGTFQHSSFLAGGATLSAGRLVVEDGILKAIWPHSGHYLPTEENFQAFVLFLKEHSVDLTNVQKSPTEGEEVVLIRRNSLRGKSLDTKISTDPEATTDAKSLAQENADFRKQEPTAAELPDMSISRLSRGLCSKIARLEIPKRSEVVDILKMEAFPPAPSYDAHYTDILPEEGYETAADILPEDGYETAEESFLSEEDFMVPKQTVFDEDLEEDDEEPIAKEKIMKRIYSHKGMRSYQLAQQLSSKWTTGAGPRIGCMRDYPSELQFRVLEQANLSPRSKSNNSSPRTTSRFSPKVSTPSLRRETTAGRSLLAPEQVPLLSFR